MLVAAAAAWHAAEMVEASLLTLSLTAICREGAFPGARL